MGTRSIYLVVLNLVKRVNLGVFQVTAIVQLRMLLYPRIGF